MSKIQWGPDGHSYDELYTEALKKAAGNIAGC